MLNPKQKALLDELISLAPKFDALFSVATAPELEKGACATYSRIMVECLHEFGWRGASIRPVYVETTNQVGIAYLKGELTAEEAKAKGGALQIWGDVSAGPSYMHAVCYNPTWHAVIDLSISERGSKLVPSHPYWAEVGKWPWWVVKFEFKNYALTYRGYETKPQQVREAKALVRAVLQKHQSSAVPQATSKTAQELVDSGLTGVALSDAIWKMFEGKRAKDLSFTPPSQEHKEFLKQIVTATVWHGTRRRESIEELKKHGFCSYTEEQAIQWLDEAHRRLTERIKAGPRTTKYLEKWKESTLWHVKEPWRGYFSVTGIEETACGEGVSPFTGRPDSESLLSGWADRNPEFVYDYLMMKATPRELDAILTEMFGKPIKVKLRVKIELRQLLNPQDMHLKQRCFSPDEIIDITPCPPKTARQLKAEIDQMWAPSVQRR